MKVGVKEFSFESQHLHAGWEEHDADWSANGGWWQVLGELATHDARGTVRSTDLTPHDTETGAVLHSLGAVHVHDLLAEVEWNISSGINTLDLDERGAGLLLGERPPVSGHDTLDIETGTSLLDVATLGGSHLLLGSGEELLNVHSRCLTHTGFHLRKKAKGEKQSKEQIVSTIELIIPYRNPELELKLFIKSSPTVKSSLSVKFQTGCIVLAALGSVHVLAQHPCRRREARPEGDAARGKDNSRIHHNKAGPAGPPDPLPPETLYRRKHGHESSRAS